MNNSENSWKVSIIYIQEKSYKFLVTHTEFSKNFDFFKTFKLTFWLFPYKACVKSESFPLMLASNNSRLQPEYLFMPAQKTPAL
jgi:hypothetical protein